MRKQLIPGTMDSLSRQITVVLVAAPLRDAGCRWRRSSGGDGRGGGRRRTTRGQFVTVGGLVIFVLAVRVVIVVVVIVVVVVTVRCGTGSAWNRLQTDASRGFGEEIIENWLIIVWHEYFGVLQRLRRAMTGWTWESSIDPEPLDLFAVWVRAVAADKHNLIDSSCLISVTQKLINSVFRANKILHFQTVQILKLLLMVEMETHLFDTNRSSTQNKSRFVIKTNWMRWRRLQRRYQFPRIE